MLGVPQGGVPVAFEVASALRAPLDVCLVHTIVAPEFPEFVLGAVAGGGVVVNDDDAVRAARLSLTGMEAAQATARQELEHRDAVGTGGHPPPMLRGQTVLLVDDGLATGATMHAAALAVRLRGAAKVVVAVPVASTQAMDRLASIVDACVSVESTMSLDRVGSWYHTFAPVTDSEVVELLAKARRAPPLQAASRSAVATGAPPMARSGHVHHLIEQLQRAALPLTGSPDDFTTLLARVRDAKVVLIGEASHGTHEFYRVRQEITKRLILEAGFTAVAAEADWPSGFRVDQYVRGVADAAPDATSALDGFRRFPQWMWRNADMLDFVGWLRHLNDVRADPASSVGFFGLDLYSLHESMAAVIDHLRAVDPAAAHRAAQRYQCFEPFGHDPVVYGRVTQLGLGQDCEQVAVAQLKEMQERWRYASAVQDPNSEASLFAVGQNARVVRNAERYYRAMFQPRQTSWNLREQHMMDTLRALHAFLERRHRGAKLVVWAHNSHVGDARATSQASYGEVSLGQLCRETWGSTVALVGFTTFSGTVLAADDWDRPGRHHTVRPALEDSVEWLMHETGIPAFAIAPDADPTLQQSLALPRLFRAIGVVYRPDTERQSHYVQTALSRQFDTVLHYDITRAVEPLESAAVAVTDELPETYPTAL